MIRLRLIALMGCWLVAAASAATFTVNSTADAVDARPGDGICATAAGVCTLRAAIQETDTLAGADTIVVPAGTYVLSIPGRGETAAAAGDLDITGDLTISGAGAANTIVEPCTPVPATAPCSGIDRIFHVDPNGAGINVTISGMTVQNGTTQVIPFVLASGGAILLGVAQTQGSPIPSGKLTLTDCVVRTSSTPRDGGGIANNAGTLTLIRTTVTDNSADNGGGIANGDTGTLSLTDSTISNNTAGQGGGIFSGAFDNAFATKVVLTNTTISGNTAGSGPGTGSGGGVFANRGLFTITNSTISGNTSFFTGGGISVAGASLARVSLNNSTVAGNIAGTNQAGGSGAGISGTVTASNTIFAGNLLVGSPSDCNGTIVSSGYNLIQSTAGCTITGTTTGNILNQDAKLGLVGDNGGPTLTRALLAGSPAIDAGNPATPGSGNGACTISDQRGIARPQPAGGRCDIGAVEFQGGGLLITLVTPNMGGSTGPVVVTIQSNGGFLNGATVKLVRAGQADIVASPATVGGDGDLITTSFDLTGKAPGTWDVVVTNLDGTSVTRVAGFTIGATVAPDLWAQVVGPSKIRPGGPVVFTVTFGNRGNVEAWGVPLDIGVSSNISFNYSSPIAPPPAQPGQVITDWNQIPVIYPPDSTGVQWGQVVLPFVPPGFTGSLQFTVFAPLAQEGHVSSIVAGIGSPYYQPNPDSQHVADLLNAAEANATEATGLAFPPALTPRLQQYLNTQLQLMVNQSRAAWISSVGAQYPMYSDTQLQVDLSNYAAALLRGGAQ